MVYKASRKMAAKTPYRTRPEGRRMGKPGVSSLTMAMLRGVSRRRGSARGVEVVAANDAPAMQCLNSP